MWRSQRSVRQPGSCGLLRTGSAIVTTARTRVAASTTRTVSRRMAYLPSWGSSLLALRRGSPLGGRDGGRRDRERQRLRLRAVLADEYVVAAGRASADFRVDGAVKLGRRDERGRQLGPVEHDPRRHREAFAVEAKLYLAVALGDGVRL